MSAPQTRTVLPRGGCVSWTANAQLQGCQMAGWGTSVSTDLTARTTCRACLNVLEKPLDFAAATENWETLAQTAMIAGHNYVLHDYHNFKKTTSFFL